MKFAKVRNIGVVALALACVMGTGSTAQAEVDLAPCTLAFCLYEHDKFKGAEVEFMFEAYTCYGSVGSLNNKASSMINNSGARVQFYDATNCAGAYGYAAAPRSSDGDLTNNGFDNKTSSIKYVKV